VQNRWKLLGILYIGYLAWVITFQSLPPVLRFVIQDLGINHAQAGLLMSVFALPGLIISIPGGLFLGLWGVRFTVGASLALALAGGLMNALVQSYELMFIGRLMAGVGGMTLLVIFPQILAHIFPEKELGTAMGLLNTAMPVGTIIPFMTMGVMAQWSGWHLPLAVGPVLGVVAFLIFLRFFPTGNLPRSVFKEKGKDQESDSRSIGAPIWLLGTAWMMFNAVVISFLTFAHKYFASQGYTDAKAGFTASMWFWGAIVVIPLVGFLSDKFGRREYWIAVGCAAMAILIPMVSPFFSMIIVLMLVLSVVQSFVPAPIYALAHNLVRPSQLGIAYGIINTMLSAGLFIGPWIIGMVWDATGSYMSSFIVMSALSVVGAVSIILCRRSSLARTQSAQAPAA
jgi:MFS family permease